MPVLTDARRFVEPLSPAILERNSNGRRHHADRASSTKPSRPGEGKPYSQPTEPRAEAGKQESKAGEKPSASARTIAAPKNRRDPLWRDKVLVECWSLNASVEHYGELEPMLHETKELIKQEVLEWAKLDREAYIRASEL